MFFSGLGKNKTEFNKRSTGRKDPLLVSPAQLGKKEAPCYFPPLARRKKIILIYYF